MDYYLIVNAGTFLHSAYVRSYPRHLVLAQLLGANPRLLTATRKLIEDGAEVILDNGAHENALVTDDQYYDIIARVQPRTVVLPDLIGAPHKASWARSLEFAGRLERRFPKRFHYMLACQGATRDEIIAGYVDAFNTLNGDRFTIGFGQSYLTFCDNDKEKHTEAARMRLVQSVRARLAVHPARQRTASTHFSLGGPMPRMHILGGRWAATEGYRDTRPICRGLDSVKPCKCALAGLWYPEWPSMPFDLASELVADDALLAGNVKQFCYAYALND